MPQILPVNYPAPAQAFTPRSASAITDFVVHHTAGPLAQTPLEIDAFERTNGDIFMPYTWLIDSAGNIYEGRPPLTISAATFGRNVESVACCLIGNFQDNAAGFNGPPSAAQFAALTDLCVWAHRQFPAISQTYAHGDVAHLFYHDDSFYATECCGNVLRALLPGLRTSVSAALQHALK